MFTQMIMNVILDLYKSMCQTPISTKNINILNLQEFQLLC